MNVAEPSGGEFAVINPKSSDESLNHLCDHRMMTRADSMAVGKKKTSISLVFLMLFSAFSMLAYVPSAAAVEQIDLAIVSGQTPIEDRFYSAFDPITFTAEIENQALSPLTNTRTLKWYVCDGPRTAVSCISNNIEDGGMNINGLLSGESANFSDTNRWFPSGASGTFTVVFKFDYADIDTSDDILSYNINLTAEFSDIAVDSEQDPRDTLSALHTYDGEVVLNTEVEYEMDIYGIVNTCGTCDLVANIGWNLMTLDGTLVNNATRSVTNLPDGGYELPFTTALPALNHSIPGRYIFEFGLVSSSGSYDGDLNSFNDLTQIEIVLDNTLDLRIASMYPSHDQSSPSYYYGEDMISAKIENIGNFTILDAIVTFEMFDAQGESEHIETCDIDILGPSQFTTCTFDIVEIGDGKELRVYMPTSFDGRADTAPSDNTLVEYADITAGEINPSIGLNTVSGTFTTADTIELSAQTSNIAANPLNYTWTLNTAIQLGYGPFLNVNASTFPLKSYIVGLVVEDALGNTEEAYRTIQLIDEVVIEEEPLMTGSIVSLDKAEFSYDYFLPVQGSEYNIAGGKEPLMILELKAMKLDDSTQPADIQSMDLTVNLSALLPDMIPFESVEILELPDSAETYWDYLESPNYYSFDEVQNISLSLNSNTVLLFIGSLPEADVSANNTEYNQLEGGAIELSWTSEGDVSNPYLGGWRVYKLPVAETGGTIFPNPDEEDSQSLWTQLIDERFIEMVSISTESWVDPEPLPSGTCASYALIPSNRANVPDLSRINVFMNSDGNSMLCGDAIAPSSTVSTFTHSYRFTNSTTCFDLQRSWNSCYELNLTWTWPQNEVDGEVTWNLYRLDIRPNELELRYVTPIATGLSGVQGETGTFNQSGLEADGIRPDRTYFYVLSPVDGRGNAMTIGEYPSENTERVEIENQWWDYNQHIIPEEPEPPEPPLGINWLGDLEDSMELKEFQYAGIGALILVVLNSLLIPMMIKRRRRLKRVMAARNRRKGTANMAEEFEDFFE